MCLIYCGTWFGCQPLASTYHQSLNQSNNLAIVFAFNAPKIWNELPNEVRCTTSVVSFRKKLKTYMFAKAYPPYPPLSPLCLLGTTRLCHWINVYCLVLCSDVPLSLFTLEDISTMFIVGLVIFKDFLLLFVTLICTSSVIMLLRHVILVQHNVLTYDYVSLISLHNVYLQ